METTAQVGTQFSLSQIWDWDANRQRTELGLVSKCGQGKDHKFKKPLLFPVFYRKTEEVAAPVTERTTGHRRSSQPLDLAAVVGLDLFEDNAHVTTTAATNTAAEEAPQLFEQQEFSYESSVRGKFEAELEFGEGPCLAYCARCGKETRTEVEREDGWKGLTCCGWGKRTAVHRCQHCKVVISRI